MAIQPRTIRNLIAGLACSLFASSLVLAQEVDNRPNLYGGVLDYLFDSSWNQDDDFG
jgi:hypothetical protein